MSGFVLFTGDHGAMLWHPRHAPQGLCAVRPDQAQNLTAMLQAQPRTGVTLLADDAGQELRQDQLPKLGWFDRRALVRRRLQQAFPPPARAACLALRRQDSGWAACYGHLPENGGSQAWTRWLATLPNPQQGAVLSSVVAAALIVRPQRQPVSVWEHVFIETLAGLRQVTLQDGLPVLTRLIAGSDDGGMLGAAVMQAQAESQNYLARQGWRPDAPTRTIVIAAANVEAALRHVLPRDVTVVTPPTVAAALGLPEYHDGTRLLAATCEALRHRLPALHYAPALAARQTQKLRRLGWATAALVCLVSVSLALQGLLAWQTAHRAMQDNTAMIERTQDALNNVRRTLDGNMTLHMRQRQAEMLRAAVLSPVPAPWDVVHVLGQKLPAQIRLGTFDWRAGSNGGTTTQLTLRLFPVATAKDAAQAEALRLYQDVVTQVTAALPHAQVKATQAPYALDPGHPFNDPAMLHLDVTQAPTAILEIREP